MKTARPLPLLLVLAIAASGCGDSDGSGGKSEANGLESKPPQEVLAQTAAALRRVQSFHLEGTQGRTTRVEADVGVPAKLRLDLRQRDASARILLVEGAFYVRGNAAFWKQAEAGEAARELGGRWLKMPSSRNEFAELTRQLDPATLSRCLLESHGTLARGGTTTVNGRRAVVIVDKGDRPGTAPGKLYVAATGEPLPLRTLATGRERPGGKKDPLCDSDTPTRPGDEATFSNYDEPIDLTAPPDALDLGSLDGGTPS